MRKFNGVRPILIQRKIHPKIAARLICPESCSLRILRKKLVLTLKLTSSEGNVPFNVCEALAASSVAGWRELHSGFRVDAWRCIAKDGL